MKRCFPCGFEEGCDVRAASHAGSWYPDDAGELRQHLEQLLRDVPCQPAHGQSQRAKAVIAPHAGLAYSGPTAAHAFSPLLKINPNTVDRIVVIGPSHRKPLSGCALPASGSKWYATPLGCLPLDLQVLEELRESGEFEELSPSDDEAEHSIEIQLNFIALWMENAEDWGLLPIVVGQLSPSACSKYASMLAPLFRDAATYVVISSDFCHWGEKFQYKPNLSIESSLSRAVPGMGVDSTTHPVNAGIEALDFRGMQLICQRDTAGFLRYLAREKNTICGRNAIRLLLELLTEHPGHFDLEFVHYSQSKLLGFQPGPRNSSVSYAACICTELSRSG